MNESEKDWKLKLRYGKTGTHFHHYTIIGAGVANDFIEEYKCPKGNAYMGMKAWANSAEEAADMLVHIGSHLGFKITGKIEIYESDPKEAPKGKSFWL